MEIQLTQLVQINFKMIFLFVLLVVAWVIYALYLFNNSLPGASVIQGGVTPPAPTPSDAKLLASLKTSKAPRVLIVTGGGIRGLATVMYLKQKYAADNSDFFAKYEIFAGTSTGAIIASALCAREQIREKIMLSETKLRRELMDYFGWKSMPKNASRFILMTLEYMYAVWGAKTIFSRSAWHTITTLWGLVGPIYPSPIAHIMDVFHDIRPRDLKQGLFIITEKVSTQNAYSFTNLTDDGLERCYPYFLGEIVTMAIATPLAFPVYRGFVDGGGIYNDPFFPLFDIMDSQEKKATFDIISENNQISINDTFMHTSNNGLLQVLPFVLPTLLKNTANISDQMIAFFRKNGVVIDVVNVMDGFTKSINLLDIQAIPYMLATLATLYPKSGWAW